MVSCVSSRVPSLPSYSVPLPLIYFPSLLSYADAPLPARYSASLSRPAYHSILNNQWRSLHFQLVLIKPGLQSHGCMYFLHFVSHLLCLRWSPPMGCGKFVSGYCRRRLIDLIYYSFVVRARTLYQMDRSRCYLYRPVLRAATTGVALRFHSHAWL